MKFRTTIKNTSELLRLIGQPARLQILLAIGDGEACVCHLEAVLGYRQAYISQHLMALRKAKLLQTRRAGRFVYYRLRDHKILDLIRVAGETAGVGQLVHPQGQEVVLETCGCPSCVATG